MLPANAFQQLIGVEVDGAAGLPFPIDCFGDLRRCPDQDVRVPDGGDAVFARRHLYRDAIDAVLDRVAARLLRQTEERPLHRVPLIADRYIGIGGPEDIKLDRLVSHWPNFFRSAATPRSTVAPIVQSCCSEIL